MIISSAVLDGLKTLDFSHSCLNPREIYLIDSYYDAPVSLIMPCHSRFAAICSDCSARYLQETTDMIYDSISLMRHPRFLTLTVRYDKSTGRMSEPVNELWHYRELLFKRLKRAGYPIDVWIGVMELPNHLHVVYDGDYIPRDVIVAHWKEVTDGSWNVDIRNAEHWSKELIANYLTKYITKSFNDVAGYLFDELKGLHLRSQYGVNKLRGPKPLKEPFTVDFGSGVIAGGLGWHRVHSDAFFVHAENWLACLVNGRPSYNNELCEPLPGWFPDPERPGQFVRSTRQEVFEHPDDLAGRFVVASGHYDPFGHCSFEPYDYDKREWLPYTPKEPPDHGA